MRSPGSSIVGLVLLLSGCAYRTPEPHIPESIPPFSDVEVARTDIVVVNPDGTFMSDEGKTVFQDDFRRILSTKSSKLSQRRSATVRAWIHLYPELDVLDIGREDGLAALILVPYAPFVSAGALTTSVKIDVDLVLDVNGRAFVGHGEADKGGSLYVPARRRAIAVAIERALADAAAKGCPAN